MEPQQSEYENDREGIYGAVTMPKRAKEENQNESISERGRVREHLRPRI